MLQETEVENPEILFGEKLDDEWIWFPEGNEKNYKFLVKSKLMSQMEKEL